MRMYGIGIMKYRYLYAHAQCSRDNILHYSQHPLPKTKYPGIARVQLFPIVSCLILTTTIDISLDIPTAACAVKHVRMYLLIVKPYLQESGHAAHLPSAI
jgi:hypothetical protein